MQIKLGELSEVQSRLSAWRDSYSARQFRLEGPLPVKWPQLGYTMLHNSAKFLRFAWKMYLLHVFVQRIPFLLVCCKNTWGWVVEMGSGECGVGGD